MDRKSDQNANKTLTLQINVLKIEVAGVLILAGNHLIFKWCIKSKLATFEVIMHQPRSYRYRKSGQEEN